MEKVSSYKDLIVWQRSMDLVETVYRITSKLPPNEQWGLTSQMRRAADLSLRTSQKIMEGRPRANTDIIALWDAVRC